MIKGCRSTVSSAIAALLAASIGLARGEEPRRNFVQRDGNKLTAEIRDAPLDQAIALLEKDASIVVRAPGSLSSRRVNVSLKDAPLERGMKQLLRSASLPDHAVLYEPGPRGRIVFVVFDKSASATGAVPASAAGSYFPPGAPPPPETAAPAQANSNEAEAAAIRAADAAAAARGLPAGATPWGVLPPQQ